VVCLKECGWIRLPAKEGASAIHLTIRFLSKYRTPNRLSLAPRRFTNSGLSGSAVQGERSIRRRRRAAVCAQIGQILTLLPLPCNRTWNGAASRTSRTTRGVADVNCVAQIQCLDQFRDVGRVGVHIVSLVSLSRSAMSAAIVRDYAITLRQKGLG
jgi:hypothetical protein